MALIEEQPHRGGQLGLIALLCMLGATGCVAYSESTNNSGMSFFPAWMKNVIQQPAEIPARAQQISQPAASFIVRFNDEPELTALCRNFGRDQEAGRAAFTEWAVKYPELDGLHLVRASYSGDLILALPMDDPAGRTAYDVVEALEALENLEYAEIDEMAKVSGAKQ